MIASQTCERLERSYASHVLRTYKTTNSRKHGHPSFFDSTSSIKKLVPPQTKNGRANGQAPRNSKECSLVVIPEGEQWSAVMPRVVLVVDDEPLVREVTATMLDDLGCETVTAASGKEALEKLTTDQRIEILVTDINMPGGWICARRGSDQNAR